MDIDFTDNSDEVLEELEKAIERAATAIGMTAETYAKLDCPVDTGRLRNSITYATKENSGHTHTYSDENGNSYSQNVGEVTGHDVYIGSNVEYMPFVELGHHSYTGKHILRNAAANHAEEYKRILKESMENT